MPASSSASTRFARLLAIALLVGPPLLVLPGLREPYRLPKLAASELLALLTLTVLSLALLRLRRVDLRDVLRLPPLFAVAPLAVIVAVSALASDHRQHAAVASWSFAIGAAALAGFALGLPRLRSLLDWLWWPATVLAGITLLEGFGLADPLPAHFGDSRYAAVSLAGNIGDLAAYLVLPLLLAQARLFVAFRQSPSASGPDSGRDSGPDSGKEPRPTGAAAKTRLAALLARLGWKGIAWIAGAAVWLGAFLAVQVLTAVLALLAASAAFWLLALDRRQRIGFAAVGLVAVVVLLVVTPVGDRVASEWSELSSNGLNAALTGRLDGWRAGLQVGKSHPVLGAGPGSYAAEFAPAKLALLDQGESFYRKHGPLSAFRNAHNEPIEIFAELGILGLLGAAWLLWWTVRGATVVPKPEHRALAVAAVVGLFVLALGHFPLRSALVGYPYLVAGAWLLSLAPPLRRADTTPSVAPERAINGKLLGLLTVGLLLVATIATARHEFERLGANRMLYIAETQAGVLARQGPQQRQIAARNLAGLQRAHKSSPADPRIPHAIGSYYLLLDQLGQSETWYRRALELEPRAETYLNLARVLERRSERDEAAELYRTAARLNPSLRREVPAWVRE